MLINECNIYNYADDNTILYFDDNLEQVKVKLEYVTSKMLSWFDVNQLQANPDKFQLITFDRHHDSEVMEMTVGTSTIKAQSCVKLLGVNIDNDLCFDTHVSLLCQKAGYKLHALSRLSQQLDFNGKLVLFNSFILSHFMYCPLIWHFCSHGHMRRIEKVQKRALRCITNEYKCTYKELLHKCDIPLMYIQRMRSMMVEVFKVLNNVGPIYLKDMFNVKETNYAMRTRFLLLQPHFNTTKYGFNSICYQGAKTWNILTNDIKSASSLNVFKSLLKNWQGAICFCSSCDVCKLYMV